MPLLADLRNRTARLHREAEQSGFIGDLLRGKADAAGYGLLLRNLLPVYCALESAIERHRGNGLAPLARPEIYRADALRCDLQMLVGPEWKAKLTLLPSGARYARRITSVARTDPALLVAHAYTRFLGDLHGGQVIQRRLGGTRFAFHAFPAIADLAAFREDYRRALEEAGAHATDPAAVAEEAAQAFELNIALSREVQASLLPA